MENQEECGSTAYSRMKGLFRFKREEHLKRRKDIQAVFKHGKNFGCNGAKLFVHKNNLTYNRICFTLSRAYGNAVKRNRARRLGREAYRLLQPRLQSGYDLILLVFPEKPAALLNIPGLETRTRQLEYLFSKAGLLR